MGRPARVAVVALVVAAWTAVAACRSEILDDVVFVDRVDPGEGEGEDEGEGADLVDVAHPRMLRGAWVATVYGINYPSNPQASAAAKEAELRGLVATLADAGLNAIFLQVRPESDALYASSLEPWSRFLSGTQGRDPGFDPLAVALDEAHARHVELHAWLNPYRGLTSSSTAAASNHVTRTLAAHAVPYDGMVWMDPGAPAVRDHVVAVVQDIVERYPVDGIHFDDYFYPYPADVAFPDDASYDRYVAAGGALGKGDWRRDNVNALIRDVAAALGDAAPHVRFGVSPFGIYRPGQPPGIRGLDAYEAISCDPVTWLDNDWIDYLAPQLYWPTTQAAQAFGTLLPWWASLTDGDGRFVVAGLNLNAAVADWGLPELFDQLEVVAAHADAGASGVIAYHAGPLLGDAAGVATALATDRFARPALPPPVVADPRVPAPPAAADLAVVVGRDGSATLSLPPLGAGDKAFAMYAQSDDGSFVLDRLVGPLQAAPTLGPGRYAVTVVGDNDRESRGRVVVVE
ncbi:MAG: hypothetical protein FJ137_06210 [Deltaproteobacteria bacterium]|nr:hypothetical protein [Deltaproteobacteria bacterium]